MKFLPVRARQNKQSTNPVQVEPARGPKGSDSHGTLAKLQHTLGNRAVGRLLRAGSVIQAKLKIGQPDDEYEREADRVAEQVTRTPEGEIARIQTKTAPGETPELSADLQARIASLKGGGRPLPQSARVFFESRLGADLSAVRVHASGRAARAAEALNARAFTLGRDVVLGAGQYAPDSRQGRRLLAHELSHVLQQGAAQPLPASAAPTRSTPSLPTAPAMLQRSSKSGQYSPQQREEMVQGKVKGTQKDKDLATRHGFKPGDIVFRLGSKPLARMISAPVTHGGIYLGDGLIHDMVGFGNRTVGVENFYAEAADPAVVKIIRFKGPHKDIILKRLVANIKARNFHLPSDPKPWNLFSSASDYKTATCLEYSHAQFLYAIKELSQDPGVDKGVKTALVKEYFASGATGPTSLIKPQQVKNESSYTLSGEPGERAAAAAASLSYLIPLLGADILADDVDPNVFKNRYENLRRTTTTERYWWGKVVTYVVSFDTFTYNSFANSTKYFQVVK